MSLGLLQLLDVGRYQSSGKFFGELCMTESVEQICVEKVMLKVFRDPLPLWNSLTMFDYTDPDVKDGMPNVQHFMARP